MDEGFGRSRNDSRRSRRTTAICYAAVAAGPGAIQSFSALWLSTQGWPAAHITTLIGGAMCLRVLASVVLARWARKFGTLLTPVALLCLGASLGGPMLAETGRNGLATLAWVWISLCVGGCAPLLDAHNFRGAATGGSFFGPRAAGSLGYMGGSLALGGLASVYGINRLLPIWASMGAFGACLVVLTRQRPAGDGEPPPVPAPRTVEQRRTAMLLALTLASAALVQASHALNAVTMLGWQARGYNPAWCSLLWQIGVGCDILLLWALKRHPVRPERLLMVGSAAAMARWIGFALDPGLPVLLLLQAMHALSFTGSYMAACQLVDRLALPQRRLAGQFVAWAVMSGLATGVAIVAAGSCYARLGNKTFWLMATLSGAALLPAGLLTRELRRASPLSH